MKNLIATVLMLLSANCAFGQAEVIVVDSGSTLSEALEYDAYINRLEFDTFRQFSTGAQKFYVATFRYQPYEGTTDLIAHLILPSSGTQYYRTLIDTFRMSGNTPEVITAFRANADRDRKLELIVLCGWHIEIKDFSGYLYETFIYKAFDPSQPTHRLRQLSSPDPIIPSEAEAIRQGERLRAKYNTEAKIRRRLKQLGY